MTEHNNINLITKLREPKIFDIAIFDTVGTAIGGVIIAKWFIAISEYNMRINKKVGLIRPIYPNPMFRV